MDRIFIHALPSRLRQQQSVVQPLEPITATTAETSAGGEGNAANNGLTFIGSPAAAAASAKTPGTAETTTASASGTNDVFFGDQKAGGTTYNNGGLLRSRMPSENDPEGSNELLQGSKDEEDMTLVRTGRLFGGLVLDIKRKAPWLASDFKDALHVQTFASVIYIYLATITKVSLDSWPSAPRGLSLFSEGRERKVC